MGVGHSKSKKKLKQSVIANSNASEFLNAKNDDVVMPDSFEEDVPVLRWHKANQNEGMIKIQREAEIRDIEAIYENSCIRETDLLNLMPDHFWTGKENKLPRYFRYQGDYPNQAVLQNNLERLKSSSLNDLIDSNINFRVNNVDNVDSTLSHKSEASYSCPDIKMVSLASLSKLDKTVPKKGILKNRNIYRPSSVTLLDIKKPNFISGNCESHETFSENSSPGCLNYSQKRNVSLQLSTTQEINGEVVNNHLVTISENHNDNSVNSEFSGYFEISPSRFTDDSSHALKVNVNRKSLIKNNLDKRLNMRPTSVDLANRNILHDQNEVNQQYDFEKTRCVLNEKLSVRPTVTELKKKKIIKFNDFIEVQETDNYDRTINKTWARLTDHDKVKIKLNQFKEKEMKIHSKSKKFTKFHDMQDD